MAEFAAVSVFVVSLIALFAERWHRVVVSGCGASAMIAAGYCFGFYDEEIAIDAIAFESLALLIGMMIVVALLETTGFFEYVAIQVAQRSNGNLMVLMLTLGGTTSVLSMILDNVTTVVLMAPMSVLIGELLGVSPMPFLISQAIFSNVGGMATLVGDPPNILIGAASGLTFTDFLIHLGPIVLVVWIFSYLVLKFLFRHDLAGVGADRLQALQTLDAAKALEDRSSASRILVVLAGIIALFFLEEPLGIAPAFAAMTGAAIVLGWTKQDAPEVLKNVEWDVILFFAGLFIMVGGLESAGVLEGIGGNLTKLQARSPLILGLVTMWTMIVLSALVDNIPITIAVIPIVQELASKGIDVQPLWWAVALGAGLGGNATPIGSTANVVVMSMSERTDDPITSRQWLADGLPTVLVATVVASILYTLSFEFMRAG